MVAIFHLNSDQDAEPNVLTIVVTNSGVRSHSLSRQWNHSHCVISRRFQEEVSRASSLPNGEPTSETSAQRRARVSGPRRFSQRLKNIRNPGPDVAPLIVSGKWYHFLSSGWTLTVCQEKGVESKEHILAYSLAKRVHPPPNWSTSKDQVLRDRDRA